jgi:hypothetical protein
MDQKIYSKVEEILRNVSVASVRSWLKAQGKKLAAGTREQMVSRVAALVEKQDLTFGQLESAVIGIEEAGGKLTFFFELETDINAAKLQTHFAKLGIHLQSGRKIAPAAPVTPKMVYAKLDGEVLRVKWSETHRKPSMDLSSDKIVYDDVTKIVVLVADLKSKKVEISFDRPEAVHPHKTISLSNPKEAYFGHYVREAEKLLSGSLTKSALQGALKKLAESKKLIRLHRDGHTNQRNNRYRVAGRTGDIRDDEDWKAMHDQSGKTWAHDVHSFYWRPEGSGNSLSREVFSQLDAINSSLRVDADCWDAEVEYAIGKVRDLQ